MEETTSIGNVNSVGVYTWRTHRYRQIVILRRRSSFVTLEAFDSQLQDLKKMQTLGRRFYSGFLFCKNSRPPGRMIPDTSEIEKQRGKETKKGALTPFEPGNT